jgi:glycosyltransferase involved in cell wall biosynthesis
MDKISFVTTCKGRRHHLEKTLPENILGNLGYPNVEFVVLDYNSEDGVEDFIRSRLMEYVDKGILVYFRESTAKYFHYSHAKNVAHVASTGDILVNVDADNYIGDGYTWALEKEFREQGIFVTGQRAGSFWGRIALRREDFLALRGYDESLWGWGGEDEDLRRRAVQRRGLREKILDFPSKGFIHHSDEERTKYQPPEFRDKLETQKKNMSRIEDPAWDFHRVNPSGFGRASLLKNFSERVEVGVL